MKPVLNSFSSRLLTVWLICSGAALGAVSETARPYSVPANKEGLRRLVVLDFQVTGDTGGSQFEAAHRERIKMASTRLRDELKQNHLYSVIDDPDTMAFIEKSGEGQNLQHCNGCELDVAKRLKADLILMPWIYRVSNLVLTLHVEIRDVSTGRVILKKALDFKGDNDTGWVRAIDYLIKSMAHRRKP